MILPQPPGLPVWTGVAPEGTLTPYVIVNHDFMQPRYLQGGKTNIEKDNIVFNIYASSAEEAESSALQLTAFYDFYKFPLDDGDYVAVMMRKFSGMWLMRDYKGLPNVDMWLYEVQYAAVIGRNPPGA